MMQPEQSDLGTALTDDAVARYLTTNPDFFVVHQDILSRLRIPHDTGKAVSLIEKQVSVLRNRCGSLENSLRDLIAVARENEHLHQRLHGLIQEIISAATVEEIVTLTRGSLQENFHAEDVKVLLIGHKPARRSKPQADTSERSRRKTPASPRAKRIKPVEGLTVVAEDAGVLGDFAELFENAQTQCGMPSTEQMNCLVGHDHSHVASAALIPLIHERSLGVVALTSRDESRFASGKGVMFLNQLGELLSRRLHAYGPLSAVAARAGSRK